MVPHYEPWSKRVCYAVITKMCRAGIHILQVRLRQHRGGDKLYVLGRGVDKCIKNSDTLRHLRAG